MAERYGTIFEVLKTKAIRHRVREQDVETACGRPIKWMKLWPLEKKEDRCKKCYPQFRKTKKGKLS